MRSLVRHTMNAYGVFPNGPFVLFLFILVAAALAQSQAAPEKPQSELGNDLVLNRENMERDVWARAKPYIDDPLPDLQRAVPELEGLEPALSQQKLNFILARVGDKCTELLQHTPNVIASEAVITRVPPVSKWRQKFEYLLLSRQGDSGRVLQEYRMDNQRSGAADHAVEGPYAQGFASMWVRLFPGNRSESRFRYLGDHEIDKHRTFVLAFAQIPELVKFPAEFHLQGTQITILYQGIAWIDSSDFRIVRMREDLLAPRPDAYLNIFSATIRFDEAHIAKNASPMWLPEEAIVEWEFKGQHVQQRHIYSHYRLYAVKTRILPEARATFP